MSGNGSPQINGYRILRVIGHGGMSTVYLAEQASLGRKVALKVMLPEVLADEVSRARFENEARTIARLEHPNIVGIFEVGRTADGLPFYSMPYMPRGHLAQRKLRGDQKKVAAVLRALLPALDYAHVRGVVHRDVKAENVLFDENDRPRLADFGIALRRGNNPRLTNAGLAVGSTAYMPPEQARSGEVDRRADLYSVGVLAWEMLTGRLPYNAADALSMALKHVQDPIPRLPAALKHWQPFIDTAMAKQPADRFASAHDMLEALQQLEKRAGRNFEFVELPVTLDTPSDTAAAKPRWIPWALGACVLGALALGAFHFFGIRAPAVTTDPVSTAPATTSAVMPASTATSLELPTTASEDDASGISPYLANAEQQLRAGQILSPANANAWNSIDAALRLNPAHPKALELTAHLFDALGKLAEQHLRAGVLDTSRQTYDRAKSLDSRRGGDGSAVALLNKRLEQALVTRLDSLVAKRDRNGALALLAGTRWLPLDAVRRRALEARVDGMSATAPVSTSKQSVAQPASVARRSDVITVSRAEFARFAKETSRPPVECSRSGLFGRKRDWSKIGTDAGPVVCVSANDAQAYASWLGKRDQHRYRLPSAGELRAQAQSPVSGWLNLCADAGCTQRMASGKLRAFDATRGHLDIGIRLVREN